MPELEIELPPRQSQKIGTLVVNRKPLASTRSAREANFLVRHRHVILRMTLRMTCLENPRSLAYDLLRNLKDRSLKC